MMDFLLQLNVHFTFMGWPLERAMICECATSGLCYHRVIVPLGEDGRLWTIAV
jgi:hypothetical protein